jgi:drug/metabolite transporter (DMT)-like permease
MKVSNRNGILLAILAASLYAINFPFSKLLLNYVPSTLMAGLLYLGAGMGMGIIALLRRIRKTPGTEEPFSRIDIPFVVAMIVLDIAAPILLLLGLSMTTAANASLLNNFEIVATALIALGVFREAISPRLWSGIAFVTAACVLLSFEDVSAFRLSGGSLLILCACVCWGIENNCTRRLSSKDPLMIVLLKGIFSGMGSVVIGLVLGQRVSSFVAVPATLAVGFVAYGLSIFFYVYAQRMLGAARTGAYYAVAPFIGTALSLAIFRDPPPATYLMALALMAIGAFLAAKDEPLFKRRKKN